VQWEGGVHRGEPGHKVILESSDGAFDSVESMAMRWYQLVSDIIDGKEILQGGGFLVVESLELWFETIDRELLMDGVICFDPFRGGTRFHRYDFNVIEIINIADHHIRVSFAGSHRELSHQVGVKLALIEYDGVHKVGLCSQICVQCWLYLNGRLRVGSYIFTPLVHVSQGRSRRQFQMFVDSVLRQAGPSNQMSVFDRL
jgi:hypothetical protein